MTDDVSSPNVEPEAVPAAPEEVLPAVDESVKKMTFFNLNKKNKSAFKKRF